MQLSLMEPTLDEKSEPTLIVNDDEEDVKAIELLKVELVLNVPPKEEGGTYLALFVIMFWFCKLLR